MYLFCLHSFEDVNKDWFYQEYNAKVKVATKCLVIGAKP